MRTLLLATLCLFAGHLSAQFVVTEDVAPETLLEDFLLGSGVLANNITYNGLPCQMGSFVGDVQLGLDEGMILSSGAASSAASLLTDQCTGGFDGDGDNDLLTVANSVPGLIGQTFQVNGVYDVSSLEFDFIPYGDSLSFTYVFGSNEYLTWVNSGFNDVFGFFISGPGISGPFEAPAGFEGGAQNIAFVPASDPELPITVSSVNNVLNAEYYIDNPGSTEGFLMNGHTVPMQATVTDLEVGETYHIRLAIGDGSDSALDSSVLLQAGSFSSYITTEVGGLGDLDNDGDLDMNDLLILIGQFGCDTDCGDADLDGDGVVGIQDILLFLGLF